MVYGFEGNAHMKRIASWLGVKLSGSNSVNRSNASDSPEESKPDKSDLVLPKDMQDLVDDATMQGISADEHSVTVPGLNLDDESSSDIDASTGFNPNDTAKLHKK